MAKAIHTAEITIIMGSDKYLIIRPTLVDPRLLRIPVSLALDSDRATEIFVKLNAARIKSSTPMEDKIITYDLLPDVMCSFRILLK